MKKTLTFLLMVMLFLLPAAYAQTDNVTINWVYPVELEGSITGFRIYYGVASFAGTTDPTSNDGVNPAPYDAVVEIADPSARSHVLTLTPGAYFTRMTVYGDVGGSSDDSPFSATESQCQVGLIPPDGVTCTVTFTFP